MSAKAIRLPSPSLGLALGLSLATIIGCVTLARAESHAAQNTTAPAGFVCQAAPGGWCDLRDWSGMDRWAATTAQAPDRN